MELYELVRYNEDGLPEDVLYDKMPLYLAKVVKDQQDTIERQQDDIEELKAAVKALQEK